MIFQLRRFPSLICRGIVAMFATIRRYWYKYRTERYFAKIDKDIIKLNWYMIKGHYNRHERRRIALKIVKHVTSLVNFDWQKRRTP